MPPTSAVPVTTNDSDEARAAVDAAERFATDTCECKSIECAEAVMADFVAKVRKNPSTSTGSIAAKRVAGALEKGLLCRDAIAYPGEPLDLDGAGPASTGGASVRGGSADASGQLTLTSAGVALLGAR